VIELIGKEPDKKITGNGPKLHEYIKEMNRSTFGRKDMLTVGECWGATPETAKLYSNPDGSELSMIFQFEHIVLDQVQGKEKWDLMPLDLLELKRVINKWQTAFSEDGWNTLFWNNHDLPRIVSRWGNDKEYQVESAKMLATLLYGLKGTVFLYQGEEIGMTNVKFADISHYKDIETLNMYKDRLSKGYSKEDVMESIYARGRDNARTPMQWDDGQNGGFTVGIPWIEVNPNFTEINVKSQADDPESILSYYKRLIRMRKENDVIIYGDFQLLLPADKNIIAYIRTLKTTKIIVICNFTTKAVNCELPPEITENKKELMIANYDNCVSDHRLRPYEARMYKIL
jgi:glycosidase